MLKRNKHLKVVLIILLLLIPASIPLFRSEFFHFSDEPNISLIYQMYRAFESGQFPPRWVPDMSYEYGYPLFNFYYVLPFYLGGVFFLFTNSLIASIKLVFFITIPLSAIFMYLWLSRHTGKFESLVGAIIYVYTPYRAVDLYVRGAIGETLSFVFFPLVALFVYKTIKEKDYKYVGFLGLAVGLLMLTHNLAPIFFIPWVFCYGLVLMRDKFSIRNLGRLVSGFILGAGLSSYFWLPAFIEKNLLSKQTPYNYLDHFPFIKQLIYSPFRYGASLPGFYDDISLQVGIVNWILVAISAFLFILYLKKKKKIKLMPFYFLVSLLGFLFLMNIRSQFFWELTGLSSYIQFPWRLLMLTTFITSAMIIFLKNIKFSKIIALTLLILAIFINVNYFQPSEYYKTDDDYFMRRFFARRTTKGQADSISSEYKNYSEDFLLLTNWTSEKPTELPKEKFTSNEINILSINVKSSVNYEAEVESEKGGLLEFNSYYFPGWLAQVDGNSVEIGPLEPFGNIGLHVDKGVSQVKVFWKETPLRLFADIVGVLSFLGISGIVLFDRRATKAI